MTQTTRKYIHSDDCEKPSIAGALSGASIGTELLRSLEVPVSGFTIRATILARTKDPTIITIINTVTAIFDFVDVDISENFKVWSPQCWAVIAGGRVWPEGYPLREPTDLKCSTIQCVESMICPAIIAEPVEWGA